MISFRETWVCADSEFFFIDTLFSKSCYIVETVLPKYNSFLRVPAVLPKRLKRHKLGVSVKLALARVYEWVTKVSSLPWNSLLPHLNLSRREKRNGNPSNLCLPNNKNHRRDCRSVTRERIQHTRWLIAIVSSLQTICINSSHYIHAHRIRWEERGEDKDRSELVLWPLEAFPVSIVFQQCYRHTTAGWSPVSRHGETEYEWLTVAADSHLFIQ